MPAGERAAADAGTQQFIDEPANVAPTMPVEPTPAREQPAQRASNEASTPGAAPASLLVRSTPEGATVSVDGVARGVTPLPVRDLALGDHDVVVSRPGYLAAERRVTLTSDRPSRSIELNLTAEPAARVAPPQRPVPVATTGTLVIESRPAGATVTVDGNRVGVTPLTMATIAPGRHSVRLEREGYRTWATTIDVKGGTRARVAASMVGGQEQE